MSNNRFTVEQFFRLGFRFICKLCISSIVYNNEIIYTHIYLDAWLHSEYYISGSRVLGSGHSSHDHGAGSAIVSDPSQSIHKLLLSVASYVVKPTDFTWLGDP